MNSSKTLDLLRTRHNYIERGMHVLVFTSSIDSRSGKGKIKSRVGLECDALSISKDDNIHLKVINNPERIDVILFDEVQFLTVEQINQITYIVDDLDIPCICYGLKTDFKSHLFPASQRLLEVADKIEEIKTICWCGRKATQNARVVNNKIIKNGEQIQVGGNESYTALCRKHYNKGNLGGIKCN